ncbi:MAG: hypothetical protein J7623_12265 [Chitinophaga sp.]|uniref:hypothetical protein n=1 Tax=Chitinophaga sp. TaxID=1869181 RepID=UPI001B14AC9F|nr:hypothetical protein [Chitinophaga sp.]MBO9729401.1 hypothetical protein [Chitinophaga sp.]
MTDSILINTMNTYGLGDCMDHYKGFVPIKDVKDNFAMSISFHPFRVDYLLVQAKLPAGIQNLGISVVDGNIAGVYLQFIDTSTILPILEAAYGRYDLKFSGIGDGYSYNWKKHPCISYTNVTPPVKSQDKEAVILLYSCDKLKQIIHKPLLKFLKD